MKHFITLYTKPNCMQCEMTKKFLKDNGIYAKIYDVSQDSEALATVKTLGYGAVPVVYVNETNHWYGFRPDELERLIP